MRSLTPQLLVVSRLHSPPNLVLRVGDMTIRAASAVKYLGITLTHNLSWSTHIDLVCNKAKHQVGLLLHRHLHSASPSCKAQVYKSFVLPNLDYCSSLWDPNHSTIIEKLESVQKLAARIVTREWHSNYSTHLNRLNWSRLEAIRKRQKLALCHRILPGHSIIPPSIFVPHPCPHLRHNNPFLLYYPTLFYLSSLILFYKCCTSV